MNWPLFIGGVALMLSAVASDPWGRSRLSAVVYLAGAAAFIAAVMTS